VHEYLTRELTGGQLSTRAATDTVEDVFVPYAFLYQVLRKGHQMIMPVGTVLRAETAATIDATNPAEIVLATPPPFVSNYDAPHSDLTPAPFFTPAPGASGATSPAAANSASPEPATSAVAASPAPAASVGPVSPVPRPSQPAVSASPTAVPY
jgi:hypothetical protein